MLKVNVKKLTEQKLPDWSLIFQNHLKNNKIKFFAKLFFYPFYVATVLVEKPGTVHIRIKHGFERIGVVYCLFFSAFKWHPVICSL